MARTNKFHTFYVIHAQAVFVVCTSLILFKGCTMYASVHEMSKYLNTNFGKYPERPLAYYFCGKVPSNCTVLEPEE